MNGMFCNKKKTKGHESRLWFVVYSILCYWWQPYLITYSESWFSFFKKRDHVVVFKEKRVKIDTPIKIYKSNFILIWVILFLLLFWCILWGADFGVYFNLPNFCYELESNLVKWSFLAHQIFMGWQFHISNKYE